VRDEPGLSIGAFVVALPPPATWLERGVLGDDHIGRLRAAKRVIGDRARTIFMLRTSMPPPQSGSGSAP
jgi:hypothetical protein